MPLQLPPLALYIHLPWCIRKCPYCDFNSHGIKSGNSKSELPMGPYVAALLADLEQDLPRVWGRPVGSIFIGGGTPSIFPAEHIAAIIDGVSARLPLRPGAEITLEANPGTIEYDDFGAYRQAGVNRVSLGVQSFNDSSLQQIGRIHGRGEVEAALDSLTRAGIGNFNIDLMVGLPGQRLEDAIGDIQQALDWRPSHISHYQLTIEPNTAFAHHPPQLPDAEAIDEMTEQCQRQLVAAGLSQYEVSAWCRQGSESRHNLNYWRYGDYLGIGAGAHGKITDPVENRILRLSKQRHPGAFLESLRTSNFVASRETVDEADRIFEFFLNQLRLKQGVVKADFEPRTGLPWRRAEPVIEVAEELGLGRDAGARWTTTSLGWSHLNTLQTMFLPAG